MFQRFRYLPLSAESPTTTEKRPSFEQRRGYLAVVIAVVLALSLGLNALTLLTLNQKTMDETSMDIPVENLRDHQFKYRTVFQPQFEYRSLDASTDELWDDEHLLTPNGGYLVRNLNGTDAYFGLGFMHQLHCLQALRKALQILTVAADGTGNPELPKSHWPHGSHYLHCLDYLRQSILCSADSTVEAPGFLPDIEEPLVSGYGVGRECYDNSVVYEMSRKAGIIED